MNPLLLSGFGISIYVEKRRLVVKNSLKNEKLEFYPHQIDHDSIITNGHSGNLTFEALRWLMKHNISLSMLNWNGELLSMTLPKDPKSGGLRVSQYRKYLDCDARFKIASEIVKQKVRLTKNLLLELSRYYKEADSAEVKRIIAIEERNADGIQSINNLLNYEGRIATFYWSILAKIFNKLYPEFHFVNRGGKSYSWNMNASDQVNALLNYGYAILESEIRRAINGIGLDPAIGFLHELAPSKTPLVYDFQELFRWLIDFSVLELLEEKKLKKSDFITTENYHIRLGEKASKWLIERISLNFNRKLDYKSGKKFTYQNILMDNVQQLSNFILDKRKDISFVVPNFKIVRNDTLDISDKILNITPETRKILGINKSTLWYQKKKLAEGKSIKIYQKGHTRSADHPRP